MACPLDVSSLGIGYPQGFLMTNSGFWGSHLCLGGPGHCAEQDAKSPNSNPPRECRWEVSVDNGEITPI